MSLKVCALIRQSGLHGRPLIRKGRIEAHVLRLEVRRLIRHLPLKAHLVGGDRRRLISQTKLVEAVNVVRQETGGSVKALTAQLSRHEGLVPHGVSGQLPLGYAEP